jgi:5-methylcytosine-specific restriction endonuclease McrA
MAQLASIMKNHTKVYLKGMGYTDTDFISCEVCGRAGKDIHHIEPRGMGGSNTRDVIENLMALCRECHHEADFGVELSKDFLKAVHLKKIPQ